MFFQTRERLAIEGIMPERALIRLKRAGIDLFDVKKTQKNQILLSVKKKDIEKVFAIYPKVCYNINVYSPYQVRVLGRTGVGKYVDWGKNRLGFLLGALLFCVGSLFADGFVFGIEFVGSSVYEREAYAVLEEYGIKPFSRYVRGNEDMICSSLIALDGVEFCSVEKCGLRVQVEMHLNFTESVKTQAGDMQAKHAGTLLSITVLRGTPLKAVGDTVRTGESLVGAWFAPEGGERVCVEVIARASIACVYEAEIAAADRESAFAKAYLAAGIGQDDRITQTDVRENGETFSVRLAYTATESFNF